MKSSLLKKIIKYSVCYLIIASFIALLFSLNNKSFAWINVSYDGLDQHLVNLQLLKRFLMGNFNTFFWNIGYGMDLFANFTYYIFGDFPSFIVIFFPDDKLSIAYELIILLRIYLSGIAFIIYTKDKKYQEKNIIIGSILYAFSSFSLFAMARHPYFLNSMILFPLLLLSVERLVLEDKKIFFILMVFILFISSFYFGYMLSIIVMIYGIILAYYNYSDKKIIGKKVLMAILFAIVGIIMASVVLIPTFEAFISSPRTSGGLYFYPLDYYPRLLASLISTDNTGNWSIIGISSIILITLPVFLADKKKNKVLFTFLIAMIIPLIIPIVGSLVGCLSFPNNRWAYVLPFIFSLITMEVLEKKVKLDVKKSIIIIGIYVVVIGLFRLKISVQEIVAIVLSFIFLYFINNDKRKYILPLIIFSIISNFYLMYDNNFGGYFKEFVKKDALTLYETNNDTIPHLKEAVNYLKEYDKGFYNVLVYPNSLNNLSLMNDYNSTTYFYSIVSKNYYSLAKELENQEMTMNKEIKTFNHRTKINELLNNKYLITTYKDYHPYGYEVIKVFDNNTFVLENKLGSSFLHLYTKSISEEQYNNLSPLLKEDALLKYFISDKGDNASLSDISSIPYQSSVSLDEKKIYLSNDKDYFELNFENVMDSEVYLSIHNLHYENDSLIKILGKNDFKIDVCLNDLCLSEWEDNKYVTPYYIENGDILINLGYFDKLSGNLKIYFNAKGTFYFDNIDLLSIKFDDYYDIVNDLNVEISNVTIEDNTLLMNANIKKNGLLSFTTNYSKYFDIYIDNKKVDSKIVNKYFLGCDIESGNHEIKLIYHNTLIFKSFCVSLFGILLFFVIILLERRKRKANYEKN